MEIDMNILEALLQALVLGGAGVASSWLLEKWTTFQGLKSEYKLYGSYVFSGLIGIAAYFVMMGLRYVDVPVGYVEWTETMVAVAFTAAGAGQIVHRIKPLRVQDRENNR